MITNARVALKALQALKPTKLNTTFAAKKSASVEVEPQTEVKEKKVAPKKAPAKKKAE